MSLWYLCVFIFPDFKPPFPFFIPHQKQIGAWTGISIKCHHETDFQQVCLLTLYFFDTRQTQKNWSHFWRPNMGRPLRIVKGYMVAHFNSPQYGLVHILDIRLEIPTKAWVWHVKSFCWCVWYWWLYPDHPGNSAHSLPSVPFIIIPLNSLLYSLNLNSLVFTYPIDYFSRNYLFFYCIVMVWTEYCKLNLMNFAYWSVTLSILITHNDDRKNKVISCF